MSSSIHPEVTIQTSSQSIPSVPSWFGEVAVIAHTLRRLNVLATIEERVRFARRRFGHYDVIDFVVVLLGYARSSERTLEAFYKRAHCAGYLGHLFIKIRDVCQKIEKGTPRSMHM